MKNVLLFGARSGTGLAVAKRLSDRGAIGVTLVREGSDASPLEKYGVSIVVGDATNPGDVARAFATNSYQAVVNTIGSRRDDPNPPTSWQ